jgi:hypothetical protein
MRAAWVVCLALLLAGCLGASKAPVQQASTPASGGNATLDLKLLPSGAPAASAPPATLAAPPQWRSGEWWDVKVTDAFDSKSYETKRVVAGTEGDRYLVGMPRDKFSNELMVLHIPGFGQVTQDTLGFDVHNVLFEPVKFPLTDGLQWDTKFEGRPFTATASVKSPTVAEVDLKNANTGEHMHLTYDATVHEVTKLVFDNYATLEVLGHGYDYQGVITVPHMFHLVFQQARIGPVLSGNNEALPPVESVKVDDTYDRVSFVELLGSALPFFAPNAPAVAAGYYKETATGPDGKTYTTEMLPSETGLKTAFFMADKPGGVWQFQHVAAGPGIVESEGIAYHVYDVEMPSGHILPSTGAHHHGG